MIWVLIGWKGREGTKGTDELKMNEWQNKISRRNGWPDEWV